MNDPRTTTGAHATIDLLDALTWTLLKRWDAADPTEES